MASYTNLNLSRLANSALQAFTKTMLPVTRFSTSFTAEDAGRLKGNVVLVPLVGTLTATTFGGTYAVCGGTKTVITVTIDKHKVVHVGQNDLDALNNSDSALDSFFYQQGRALAQAVVEDILTLVTTSNFAMVSAVAAAAISIPEFRAVRLAMNQANCPPDPRVAIIDSTGYDGLFLIPNFVQAQLWGSNQSVLVDAKVPRALGFDLYELNNSFISGASVNAFFAHPSAIAVAMRYVAPQRAENYDATAMATDAQTGMTIGLRDYYDPLTGTRYIALECNYGKSAGITNGGRIVKRTD